MSSRHARKLERTKIEKAINDEAERLEELDKHIADVQRTPNVIPAWMERRAGIKDQKAETLQELRSEKRTTLATIADLWKRFHKLDAKVKEADDGETPDWWRGTLTCPKCPSQPEAEDALR